MTIRRPGPNPPSPVRLPELPPVPAGLGLASERARQRMVDALRAVGIRDEEVLAAMNRVPRHQFIDAGLASRAYEDVALPIGHGQTISKPSTVARMIEQLVAPIAAGRRRQARVLEVGTGCGYQAALLALLARRVVSIERLRDLHLKARQHLDQLRGAVPGMPDIRLVYGDGMLGHAPQAPYDTIIAAAGGSALPQAWLDQLAPGGRLVAPMEEAGRGQVLTIVDRLPDGSLKHSRAGAVLFVPLKSGMT